MSSVNIIDARYPDVVEIARNMRLSDAEEIWPVTIVKTPETLAVATVAGYGLKYVARYGAVPVATWGATEIRPQVASVWMFATDRWPKVALSVTRHINKTVMSILMSEGYVRAECWSHDNHHVAHRWLELLGAVREATVEDYGQNRVPYHCYSWTKTRLESENVCWTIGTKDTKATPYATSATPARATPNEG
tara:strand:+ start:4001 stop:4576 length:576 start_codon:yes stop_codon:yes gene_type:complete